MAQDRSLLPDQYPGIGLSYTSLCLWVVTLRAAQWRRDLASQTRLEGSLWPQDRRSVVISGVGGLQGLCALEGWT